MQAALAAEPQLAADDRLRRTTGFHFVDHVGARRAHARRHRRRSPRPPTRSARRSYPRSSRPPRRPSRRGSPATSSTPAGTASPVPEANLAEAVRALEATKHADPGAVAPASPAWQRALADRAAAAYDRPMAGGRRAPERAAIARAAPRPPASASPDGRVATLSAWNAAPAGPSSPTTWCGSASSETQKGGAARRAARPRRGPGRAPSCWRTAPGGSSRWRAASPIR